MRTILKQYSIFLLSVVVLVMAPGRRAGAQSLAQDIEQLVMDYQKLGELKQMLSEMMVAYEETTQGTLACWII